MTVRELIAELKALKCPHAEVRYLARTRFVNRVFVPERVELLDVVDRPVALLSVE